MATNELRLWRVASEVCRVERAAQEQRGTLRRQAGLGAALVRGRDAVSRLRCLGWRLRRSGAEATVARAER